jgi:hypothetical protein
MVAASAAHGPNAAMTNAASAKPARFNRHINEPSAARKNPMRLLKLPDAVP